MKYCVKCGNQLMDEAVVCPRCGCSAKSTPSEPAPNDGGKAVGLGILCILGAIAIVVIVVLAAISQY